MSKTFKTRPYWVKMNSNDYANVKKMTHSHEDGVCDVQPLRQGDHYAKKCGYEVNYYGYNAGVFGRKGADGRWVKTAVAKFNGKDRTRLRRDLREMLKLSLDDIEDYDIINPRPRNQALWDAL